MAAALTLSRDLASPTTLTHATLHPYRLKVKRDKAGDVKKAKPGKTKIKVNAKAPKETKPRTDADTVTIQCLPRTVACASASGAFLD